MAGIDSRSARRDWAKKTKAVRRPSPATAMEIEACKDSESSHVPVAAAVAEVILDTNDTCTEKMPISKERKPSVKTAMDVEDHGKEEHIETLDAAEAVIIRTDDVSRDM